MLGAERQEEEEEEEEKEGECVPGRRSKPINLATKVGVFVPGELVISADKSFKFPPPVLVPPLVLICIIFFWVFKTSDQNNHHSAMPSLLTLQNKQT